MLSRETINIPKGRKVKFHPFYVSYKDMIRAETSISGEFEGFKTLEFMLTNELTFSVSADYSKVLNTSISPLRSLLQGVSKALIGEDSIFTQLAGGDFKKLGYQTFTGGSPLDLSLSCSVIATTDAKEQVITPIWTLQNLVVPKAKGALEAFVYPGVSPIANSNEYSNANEALSAGDYVVTVGNFVFDHILVKRVTPTFSKIVDQNGWPVSADIQIDLSTMFVAYDGMLERLYNGVNT